MASAIGHVEGLWRYPVKSMLGEALSELQVNERGGVADREFAIRDAEGKFGSGKTTRRFRRIDGLFGFRAALTADGLVVQFPDGSRMAGSDPAIHDRLSAVLGQPVSLAREGAVSHFDEAPLHLVTTASVAWLQGQLLGSRIDVRRFRPNITIKAFASSGPIEEDWIGQLIGLGKSLRIKIRGRAERCVMVTNPQDELPGDPAILRLLAASRDGCFGVYADVVEDGEVRVGDQVIAAMRPAHCASASLASRGCLAIT